MMIVFGKYAIYSNLIALLCFMSTTEQQQQQQYLEVGDQAGIADDLIDNLLPCWKSPVGCQPEGE